MASILVVPCQPQNVLLKKKLHRYLNRHCHDAKSTSSYLVIRNEKTSSFSCRSTVNVPLNELPGVYISKFSPLYTIIFLFQASVSNTNTHVNFAFQASFDQYMDDKHRVVQAVFSDKRTTKQLNEVIFALIV